jgi:hypothetical protein
VQKIPESTPKGEESESEMSGEERCHKTSLAGLRGDEAAGPTVWRRKALEAN